MTTLRPHCAWCGSLLRPWTETVYAPNEEGGLLPVRGWRYAGNLKVVARKYETVLVRPDGTVRRCQEGEENFLSRRELEGTREHRLASVSVWDGERYEARYWPFCRTACAGQFAVQAFRDGHRRGQRKAS